MSIVLGFEVVLGKAMGVPQSGFVIFLVFGIVLTIAGIAAGAYILKPKDQPIRFDKWGFVVVIPIVVPIIAALLFEVLSYYRVF
ncbi:hypothetical protein [Leptolyngbya sp. NIES-2104]|uniref:hypothetical protein n=1 Tax=Leptolyngbya sp. NIES-2104 TaxID=1552121 RepID=UPI0006EC67C6|nr:hypothetical protein [Leptolyngbya sp. NIES-2104]GAP94355.1 hypothetical protein NIES2104_08660 [Leptolyngbya sp. NIES-2104]